MRSSVKKSAPVLLSFRYQANPDMTTVNLPAVVTVVCLEKTGKVLRLAGLNDLTKKCKIHHFAQILK